MDNRVIKKITLSKIISFFIILAICKSTFATQIYVPEPIVFVHGLNSAESTWNDAKNALKKYFIDENTGIPKYDYPDTNQKWYYPKCDYESMNTGDIPTIAQSKLTGSVYAGLGALNEIPDCITKKVNIVGHSMGGLVARSLLKQSGLQNSIDKVIFIGTPHNGSPYASALWLMSKVKEEKIPRLLRQNLYYFAMPVFSPSNFLSSDRLAYANLATNLMARYSSISLAFMTIDLFNGPNPKSTAIDQLRLNVDTSYHDVVYGIAIGKVKSAEISASLNEFFRGKYAYR